MKKSLFLFIIAFLLVVGCKKSGDKEDLVIKAGFMCGWGAGEDSLNISESIVDYVFYIPSKSSLAQTDTSRIVKKNEWEEILNSFDIDDFMKLEYNTCNICVDGCDEWISIQNDRIYHKIRFTKGEQIDVIKGLQDKIAGLREEFSK
jgi:hypothetical protein